ncbi:hypothetical protein PM082_022874 [Marasmius tenuissimus]|nr:hypothetical protein PM082_022874 [Marasmius tenuissimus]
MSMVWKAYILVQFSFSSLSLTAQYTFCSSFDKFTFLSASSGSSSSSVPCTPVRLFAWIISKYVWSSKFPASFRRWSISYLSGGRKYERRFWGRNRHGELLSRLLPLVLTADMSIGGSCAQVMDTNLTAQVQNLSRELKTLDGQSDVSSATKINIAADDSAVKIPSVRSEALSLSYSGLPVSLRNARKRHQQFSLPETEKETCHCISRIVI